MSLNGTWSVTVEDNGPGWPADRLDRMFEPYMTTKAKGTGLGLAIVKKIVDNHKGFIKVTSEPCAGTCFIVMLPKSENQLN